MGNHDRAGRGPAERTIRPRARLFAACRGLLVLSPMLQVSCHSGPPTDPPPVAAAFDAVASFEDMNAEFRLGPHDLVRVKVLEQEDISTGTAGIRVDPDGLLHLPLLGAVDVRGKTLDAVRKDLGTRYREYLVDPDVTVSIVEFGARRFYLLGQVEKPGAYVMDRPLTALQALTFGGRFQTGGDREEILLLRLQQGELVVQSFNAAIPDVHGMIPVEANDLLFVRRTGKGYFAEELLPIINGVAQTVNAFGYLGLVADALND